MAEVNVLIIEDEPQAASLLEKTLKDVGYNVYVASEPSEGIALLRNTAFVLVITELRSGKMNGIEVTKAVHKVKAETNVIVATFYSFIESAMEALEAGAYGYITKPFNTSEIRIVAGRAVERYFLLSSGADKEQYIQMAAKDGLTGLYNYRYFKGLISVEFSRIKRHGRMVSLLMVDIDNFKKYNDTYGHPAGDELLKKAAGVFRDSLREVDTICRYGGEEFAITLPETDKKGAQIVAERLRTRAGLYMPVTVSIGIAAFPEDADNPEVLIEKADAALYQAKQTGKNKFCVA